MENNKIYANQIGTKCVQGFTLEIMGSAAGRFVGTVEIEDGIPYPNCRMSEYFKNSSD